jgi:hypothetical protein
MKKIDLSTITMHGLSEAYVELEAENKRLITMSVDWVVNTQKIIELEAENQKLREALGKLRQEHLIMEDCWYSCPLAKDEYGEWECCRDIEDKDRECDCGADEHNAIIDEALKEQE